MYPQDRCDDSERGSRIIHGQTLNDRGIIVVCLQYSTSTSALRHEFGLDNSRDLHCGKIARRRVWASFYTPTLSCGTRDAEAS